MSGQDTYEAEAAAENERAAISNSVDQYADKYGVKTLFADFMAKLMKRKPDNLIACLRECCGERVNQNRNNVRRDSSHNRLPQVLSKKEKTVLTAEVEEYLNKMQVRSLFKTFAVRILKDRPENPAEWLHQYLAETDLDLLVQDALDDAIAGAQMDALSHNIKQQVASIADLREALDDDDAETTLVVTGGDNKLPPGTQVEEVTNNGTLTIGGDSNTHIIIQQFDNYGSSIILSDSNVQINNLENHGTVVGDTTAALEVVDADTALGMDVGQFVEQDSNTIRVGNLQNINALIIGGNSNTHVIIETLINNGTLTVDKDSETRIGSLDNQGTLVELGQKTRAHQ